MRLAGLSLALLPLVPSFASAQPVASLGGVTTESDLLYFAGEPQQAYDLLQQHLEAHPDDYDALWRAVRAAVVLGMEEEGVERQNMYFDPAIVLGDRAVAARPEGVDGLYWRGAAEGRRAINAGTNYAAELAQRVYDDAHAILAIDPDHGGAHNLLGRLNYEIMSLSAVKRFVGRLVAGTPALKASSWEAAEEHLLRATELWPDMVPFQFDLAQLYLKRGREEEAQRALSKVTEMAAVHPLDTLLQREAGRYLEELNS